MSPDSQKNIVDWVVEAALKVLPPRHVAYMSAFAGGALAIVQAEAALPTAWSLWPDPPQQLLSALIIAAGASATIGLRRGQQKAEDAARESVAKVAEMPAKELGGKLTE